jgi:hypothetical protein
MKQTSLADRLIDAGRPRPTQHCAFWPNLELRFLHPNPSEGTVSFCAGWVPFAYRLSSDYRRRNPSVPAMLRDPTAQGVNPPMALAARACLSRLRLLMAIGCVCCTAVAAAIDFGAPDDFGSIVPPSSIAEPRRHRMQLALCCSCLDGGISCSRASPDRASSCAE